MAASTTNQPFEAALKSFKAYLSDEQQKQFECMTLQKLETDISELQNKQHSEFKLRNLSKLSGFLEGMRQYEGVLDLFVNASAFVAFIWGPIKLLLRIASTYVEALDELLDAYQRIGEVLPLLQRYIDLIRGQPHMTMVLELIYEDILHFHGRALEIFKGRRWTKLFKSAWKTFQTDFSRILSNFKNHQQLISSHATLSQFEEFKRLRDIAEEQWRFQHESEQHRRQIAVQTWLMAANAKDQQYEAAKPRKILPQTGQWLLSTNVFKNWTLPGVTHSPVMWLTGIPGAGKTLLASVAVDELESKGVNVIYFFCHYKDPQRNSFVSLAKSLLLQLLTLNPTLLAYFYEEQCTSGETAALKSPELVKRVLETALTSIFDIHIVLDGIDECMPKEMESIFSWVLGLINQNTSSPQQTAIRCLFISRDERIAGKHLRHFPTLRIKPENTVRDIANFVDNWKVKVQKNFALKEAIIEDIAETLIQRADGMFLFVQLVSQNLLEQSSQEKLLFEVKDDKFPKALGDAYERIVYRLLNESANAPEINWLLGCLVCAKRPMRWYEFQGTISINLDNDKPIDFNGRQLRFDAKELGGSIVELGSNGAVELVHRTAEHYLVSQNLVVKRQTEYELAKLCLGYLTLQSLSPCCSDDEFIEFASQGHYAFLDYAVAYWYMHVEAALAAGLEPKLVDSLSEQVDIFLDNCSTEEPENHSKPMRPAKSWQVFENQIFYGRLVFVLHATKKQITASGKSAASNAALTLHMTVEKARKAIESLSIDPKDLELYYGVNIFKCPRMNCRRFYDGFSKARTRDDHIDAHDRPYQCTFENCPQAGVGFVSMRSLEAHLSAEHGIDVSSDESFPSLDPLKRQLDSIEDVLDSKSKPKVADSSFKCTFEGCSRSFTSRHNLNGHLRSHSKAKPFLCQTCNYAFARQNDCKRHEEQHSSDRVICGGIIRGIDGIDVEWGCGKDFSRPDSLQAHWHKTEIGKACIKPLQDHDSATNPS